MNKGKIKKTLSLTISICLIFFNIIPIFSISKAQAEITLPQELLDWLSKYNGGTMETAGLGNSYEAVQNLANKQEGPTVNIAFTTNGAFISGAKVTAKTVLGGFKDSTKKLYFTWYLKRSECNLKNNVSENNNCDLDGDRDITVNDWKIAAAKIIARGDFEPKENTYSSLSEFDEDLSGENASPSVTDEDEGWVINFKKDNQGDFFEENNNTDDVPNCYVQEPDSGVIYELRKTTQVFNDCPGGYRPACVKDTTAPCNVLNPEYEDDLLTPDEEKTIENIFNTCAVDVEASEKDRAKEILECFIKDEDDLKNFKSYATCKEEGEPICVADGGDTELLDNTEKLIGIIFSKNKISTAAENESNGVCSALAKENKNAILSPLAPPPNWLDNSQPNIIAGNEKCASVVEGLVDEKENLDLLATGDFNKNDSSCSFEKSNNLCKHLFPYFPKNKVKVKGDEVDLTNAITGDGKFSIAEEKFWRTDPLAESTNGKTKDEASVMGLGVDEFTWTYNEGDKIGVVVEGTSLLATDHNDSAYRIMWAFSKDKCTALKDLNKNSNIEKGIRGFYPDYDSNKGIFTAEFDLNECLEENLLDPANENENEVDTTMKIGLSTNPKDPVNDSNGFGDTLEVAVLPQNTTNFNNIYYEWKIEKSEDGGNLPTEETTWTDITSDMLTKYKNIKSVDIGGIGKRNISFLLDFPEEFVDPLGEGVFYLRFKVTATEQNGNNNQISKGSLIVKIRQQENQILTYSVVASNEGMLNLKEGGGTNGLICNDITGKNTCLVTKNEIVALVVPNANEDLKGFSWKVNGVDMDCNGGISPACSGKVQNTLIFPILGNVGEAIYVVATAVSHKTGATIKISRYFVIVEPQIRITAADSSNVWPKLLGYYKDTNGNKTADYSSSVFETNPNKTITLEAKTYSAWNYQGSSFEWSIDGELQGDNNKTLSFLADRNVGESYNVGLVLSDIHSAEQDKQANNLRKALYKNWGISPDDYVDNITSTSIQINVIEDVSQSVVKANNSGIFASLSANFPQQFMFLLKIAFTGFVLLFSMGLIFALVPETAFEKSKKTL